MLRNEIKAIVLWTLPFFLLHKCNETFPVFQFSLLKFFVTFFSASNFTFQYLFDFYCNRLFAALFDFSNFRLHKSKADTRSELHSPQPASKFKSFSLFDGVIKIGRGCCANLPSSKSQIIAVIQARQLNTSNSRIRNITIECCAINGHKKKIVTRSKVVN